MRVRARTRGSGDVLDLLELALVEGLQVSLLARNEAGVEQALERGVHRAHAFRGARLHHVLELLELALTDQVRDRRRVDQDLERGDAAAAGLPPDQLP